MRGAESGPLRRGPLLFRLLKAAQQRADGAGDAEHFPGALHHHSPGALDHQPVKVLPGLACEMAADQVFVQDRSQQHRYLLVPIFPPTTGLHPFRHRFGEAGAGNFGRVVHQPREIVGDDPIGDRALDAADHQLRRLAEAEVPQHHFA